MHWVLGVICNALKKLLGASSPTTIDNYKGNVVTGAGNTITNTTTNIYNAEVQQIAAINEVEAITKLPALNREHKLLLLVLFKLRATRIRVPNDKIERETGWSDGFLSSTSSFLEKHRLVKLGVDSDKLYSYVCLTSEGYDYLYSGLVKPNDEFSDEALAIFAG